MLTWKDVLAAISTLAAMVFGFYAFIRSQKQDDRQNGVMLTEIGYVKSGIDDIKRKQEKIDEQHIEVVTRLTAVESSAKQAHKRLDRIEGKGEQNND